MSDGHTIALVLGIFPLQILVYNVVDRWFTNRTRAIVTGVDQGVLIPIWQRRLLIYLGWMDSVVGTQVGFLFIMGIAWTLLGRSTTGEEAKLLAYVCAFVSFLTVVGWVGLTPFWYVRLVKAVRQAEAEAD